MLKMKSKTLSLNSTSLFQRGQWEKLIPFLAELLLTCNHTDSSDLGVLVHYIAQWYIHNTGKSSIIS